MAVKQRPILFSTEMVKAILDGRKRQTRRVIVKPWQVNDDAYTWRSVVRLDDGSWSLWSNKDVTYDDLHEAYRAKGGFTCPYGRVGDLLWVREAHILDPPHDGSWDYYMFDDGGGSQNIDEIPERYRSPEHVIYRASSEMDGMRWRPSIHMPKWAARIWLRVTDVQVQRLWDIEKEDVVEEGVWPAGEIGMWKHTFVRAWNEINEERGYEWKKNPWVWVISFDRVKP